MVSYWASLNENQRQELCDKISDSHEKIWDSLSDDERNKKMEHLFTIEQSFIEKRISSLFITNGIYYIQTLYPLNGKFFDFRLGDTLIEANGDYWHANPAIYDESDTMCNGQNAGVIWKKDKAKKNIAIDNGFKLITIWESEMKQLSDDELLYILLGDNYENS